MPESHQIQLPQEPAPAALPVRTGGYDQPVSAIYASANLDTEPLPIVSSRADENGNPDSQPARWRRWCMSHSCQLTLPFHLVKLMHG